MITSQWLHSLSVWPALIIGNHLPYCVGEAGVDDRSAIVSAASWALRRREWRVTRVAPS